MSINGIISVVFLLGLWAGSCWFFYSIGWLHGNTTANLANAEHLQELLK